MDFLDCDIKTNKKIVINTISSGNYIISFENHSLNKVGISFCNAQKKGLKNLKNQIVIGKCYYIVYHSLIPNRKMFDTNKIKWAIQHLRYDIKRISKLATLIINNNFK